MNDDDDLNRAELRRLADIATRGGDERTAKLARDVARRVADPDFNPHDVGEALKRATQSAAQAVERTEAELLANFRRHQDCEAIEALANSFASAGDTDVGAALRAAVKRARKTEDYWPVLQPASDAARARAAAHEAARDRKRTMPGQKLASMKH